MGQLRAAPGTGQASTRSSTASPGRRARRPTCSTGSTRSLTGSRASPRPDEPPSLAPGLAAHRGRRARRPRRRTTRATPETRRRAARRAGPCAPASEAPRERPRSTQRAARARRAAGRRGGATSQRCARPGPRASRSRRTRTTATWSRGRLSRSRRRVCEPGQRAGAASRRWRLRVPARVEGGARPQPPARARPGRGAEIAFAVTVADGARYSQPYWRRNPAVDRYDLEIPAAPDAALEPARRGVACAALRQRATCRGTVGAARRGGVTRARGSAARSRRWSTSCPRCRCA